VEESKGVEAGAGSGFDLSARTAAAASVSMSDMSTYGDGSSTERKMILKVSHGKSVKMMKVEATIVLKDLQKMLSERFSITVSRCCSFFPLCLTLSLLPSS
jgi:hypothetical protein